MTRLTTKQINILSHLFSPSIIQALAKKGESVHIGNLLKEAQVTNQQKSNFKNIGSIFETVFEVLKKSNIRNEYIYKSALTHKRLLGIHSLNTATMLSEFRAGTSKADIVILNGTSTVYEVKSERDSLNRLTSQLANYQKIFLRTNVITSEKQVMSVLDAVPNNIGVLCLNGRYQISTIREAKEHPSSLCSVSILNSLRKNEAQTILTSMNIDLPNVPNTQLYQKMSAIFKQLDPELVHNEMVKVLKTSRNQARLNNFINKLPRSMQAAALSVSITTVEQHRLLSTVNMPLDIVIN